jgi:ATP-dependent DNA helicase RecG
MQLLWFYGYGIAGDLMLTKNEVYGLVGAAESECLEKTRSIRSMDKLGEAICAFANNLSGDGACGYLLIGVNDDGSLCGARFSDEDCQRIGALKSDGNLLPAPSLSTCCYSFEDGDVILVEVYPSRNVPVAYKGNIWVRVGPRRSVANAEDRHRLEERYFSQLRTFEELPCTSASLDDLDLKLFRNDFLPKAIEKEIIEDEQRPIEQQLAALRFYDLDKGVPTHLGVLLFGKHPERFLPGAYLQYVAFEGDDNGSDILTAVEFRGGLLKMIPKLDEFVRTTIARPRPVLVTALREEERVRYPIWATRELLLNALIHRDYAFGNAPIKFYEYAGARFEIVNPGGLYGRVNVSNFPCVNDYRNPLLALAIKIMGYVNKFNRGIPKVKKDLAENGNPPPYFDLNRETEFRVTVLAQKSGGINNESGGISAKSGGINNENGGINLGIGGIIAKSGGINECEQICQLILDNPGIKCAAISEKSGIAFRTVERNLCQLKRACKIEYRGSKRTGGFFVRT